MKKIILPLLLTSFSFTMANECINIENDIARLACYDDAFKTQKAESQEVVITEQPDTWYLDQSQSPLDDSIATTIYKIAQNPTNQADSAVFFIRCKNNTTEAFFSWPEYVSSQAMRVAYRTDKDKAISDQWSASTEGKATFVPKAIPFIRNLLGKDSLYVEAYKSRGGAASATFSLKNIDEAIKPIQKACNWQ